MRQHLEFRAITGVLIWIGIVAVGIIGTRQSLTGAPDATRQIAAYIGKQRRTVELEFEDYQLVATGDPVFLPGLDNVAPIGVVKRLKEPDNNFKGLAWVKTAYVSLYGAAPQLSDGDYVMYHSAPDSTAWVLQTMLPPEKRREITKLIVDSYLDNQEEIVSVLRPVMEESLREASEVVRLELKRSLESREDEFQLIGQRFQKDLVDKEIIPLLQREIWPLVRYECEPLVSQIGQEIWSQVSVFRFGWRYLYDQTPFPDKALTEREFRRFADEKAIPILTSHIDEFVDLQQKILRKIVKNENVKATIARSLKTVATDPEVQYLITEVLQEVLLNNQRLRDVIQQHWQGPEATRALALASERLEPTINEIGISLFGSPRDKITPEFARVLRHRILHKDSRWLTLHTETPDANRREIPAVGPAKLPVRIASASSTIPYAPARDTN